MAAAEKVGLQGAREYLADPSNGAAEVRLRGVLHQPAAQRACLGALDLDLEPGKGGSMAVCKTLKQVCVVALSQSCRIANQ